MTTEGLYPKFTLRTGQHYVTSACFTNHSKGGRQLLITGSNEGILQVWNLTTQAVVQEVTVSQEGAAVLSLFPTTNGIASHCRSAVVVLWEWDDTENLVKVKEIRQDALSLTFCCSDTDHFAGCQWVALPHEESVSIYNLFSGQMVSVCKSPAGMCMSINLFNLNNRLHLLLGDEVGQVTMYEMRKSAEQWKENANNRNKDDLELSSISISCLNICDNQPVLTLDYNVECNYGVCASVDESIRVWRIVPSNQLTMHNKIKTASAGYNCVKLRKDCKLFIACSWDGFVRLYSVRKCTPLARLDFHRESVMTVDFDSRFNFVSASKDKMLCFWDLYSKPEKAAE